ncbi:HD-GYP domain-containing protein [Marinitoga sp. 38H-ov]|uniref:HD-GYP domain-containing protein n=1 Tax=Marinitoga sp. 38H-ov TaxID=1755814 RepID=UPI0019D12565|nr:HD-GYP domain-containing protein [Marinitoga sp. 38H-ov]
MRYTNVIENHIKNSIIQNFIFLCIIIIIWVLSFFYIFSAINSVSNINLDKFNELMENYYYHLKYISIIDDENLLKDLNMSKIYVIDNMGNIRKKIPYNIEENINESTTVESIFSKIKNINNTFIFRLNDNLYLGSKINNLYVVGVINKLNINESTDVFITLHNNNQIIYSKFNINKIKQIDIINRALYISKTLNWKNIYITTYYNITNFIFINLIISLVLSILIIWNFVTRNKNIKLISIFEQEFRKVLKSMDILLKELKILDSQSFINLSPKDFEGALSAIKDNKFYFDELNELKEVEIYTIKEILELFEEISASNEQMEATNKELETLYNQLEEAYNDLEDSYRKFSSHLSAIAEKYDEVTGNHIERVSEYSKFIAVKMNFDEKFVKNITIYSSLHDIGKLLVSHEILNKPGGLTKSEYDEMKKHTIYAEKIFGNDERFKMAKNIAMYHHERYDGSGYPFGLKGEEIPIEARIVALADVYDALRSDRPYKSGYSHEEAYNIIVNGDYKTKPSIFDPRVLKVFKIYHREFDKIYTEYKQKELNLSQININ